MLTPLAIPPFLDQNFSKLIQWSLLIDESYKAPNRLAQVSMFRILLSEILKMIQ